MAQLQFAPVSPREFRKALGHFATGVTTSNHAQRSANVSLWHRFAQNLFISSWTKWRYCIL